MDVLEQETFFQKLTYMYGHGYHSGLFFLSVNIFNESLWHKIMPATLIWGFLEKKITNSTNIAAEEEKIWKDDHYKLNDSPSVAVHGCPSSL
jgi:hypothetical protein